MKNVFYIFTLIGLTLLPSTKALSLDESILISQTKTNAHDVKIPPYLPLSGKASAAFSRNQGNVDEGALKYSFSLSSQGEANKVYLKIKGKRTEKRQKRSKEEHEMSLLNVYHLNHTSGFYGKVTSYQNEPRGYEHQWRLGVGYLHTWYQSNNEKYFKTRMGYQNRANDYTTGADSYQDYLLLGCRVKYPLMENISLFMELNYGSDYSNRNDYETEGLLSFTFYVNKSIDIKIDYERFYSYIPAPGKKKTDTSLATSLIYKF
ncbi:MAG: hypothetical protein DRQ49_09150 [Gammaproteobacteria bacterium]|nr:MAG: hypothetical protein DRQ49_09150 [Gammaproteobacteria bacterium]RKZ44311.1 MAG: hypothetical protein DRQ41_03140 [Gammaproteobacteria bacterium]RKZ75718.1 MAG: hypothetical protein DRQ57_06420 [Gammaproteobacteria bacterium]